MKRLLYILMVGLAACTPKPVPTPPPPTPAPTPTPISCPVKVEGDYFVDLHIGTVGPHDHWYTATAKYCGLPVRSDIFNSCGTKCCTLGVDGHSQTAIDCETVLSGIPSWQADGTLQLEPDPGGNPYNIVVGPGHGTLKACGKSGCSNEVVF